ncbi:MAG TPA: hypothetical protein VKU19_24145 [Bryobacteraceae bacterium]|nr:hypothetical protein [Bryobacteraceae bacterium]
MRNRLFLQSILVTGLLLLSTGPLSADAVFTLLPPDGNVFGAPGSLVGWGYSLTNTDPSDWFMSSDLNSDSFSNGTPTLIFDFPILAPGATVTEVFDPVNSIGLFELQWDPSAPAGFVNSGNFVLRGQLWDGDPLNGGSFIADAIDTAVAYSATVSSSTTSTPEPSCALLLSSGIALLILSLKLARWHLA